MSRRIYLDGTNANTFPFLFGTPFIFRKVDAGEDEEQGEEEEAEYIEQPEEEVEEEEEELEDEQTDDGGVLVGDQQEIGPTSHKQKAPRKKATTYRRKKPTADDKIDEEEENEDADDEDDPLKEATINEYDDTGGGGFTTYLPTNEYHYQQQQQQQPYTKAELERIRVDPNYEWLLKDLNLTNEKRVIDVTDIIEKHQDLLNKTVNEPDQNLLNKVSLDTTKEPVPTTARVEDEYSDQDQVEDEGETEEDEQDEEDEDEGEEEEQPEHDEEDDHRKDRSYISKLYEKLVQPGENNNESVNESKTYYPEEEVNTTTDQDYSIHSSTTGTGTGTGTGTYADWSKNFRANGHPKAKQQAPIQPQQQKDSDEDTEVHKINTTSKINNNKFSKSFEVLDSLIDRVDNGIKLKRGNNRTNEETDQNQANNHPEGQSKGSKVKYSQRKATSNLTINGSSHYNGNHATNGHGEDATNDSKVVVESLKKEWSSMLNKLEHDYKNKLDEQQRLNDAKLKSFQDEIKKCIYEQQEKIMESQAAKQRYEEKAYTPDITRHTTPPPVQPIELVDACTSPVARSPTPMNITAAPVTSSSIVDNAKYISNLRIELKAKHARHVQDLKDYYEKELDEHKAQLNAYKLRYGIMNPNDSTTTEPDEDYKQLSEEYKLKYEQLIDNFNELKNTNEALLNKIKEDNDHLKYLTHENYELRNKVNTLESTLGNLNEKLSNLQDTSTQFESQLTESIKQQDKYMRELQLEKRALLKKVQECDDLRLSMKFYEQKCDGYELKLDERDNIIARLKTKLVQMENDMTRLDYEYQKLRTSYNTKSNNAYQQPYIAASNGGSLADSKESDYRSSQNQSHVKHHFGPPLQLPIRNQSKYQSNPNLSMNGNSHHLNQSSQQPTTSPNKTHVNIFCNNSNSNNNSSSSSPSSKSPRSRSPPPQQQHQQQQQQQQPITVPISSPVNHKINLIRVNKSPNSELTINTNTSSNNNTINNKSSSYNFQQQPQRENQSLHFQVNPPQTPQTPTTHSQNVDQDDITASTFGSSNSPYNNNHNNNNNNNYYSNNIYSSTNNNINNNQHQQNQAQNSPPSGGGANSQVPLNGCINGVCSINANPNHANHNSNPQNSTTGSANNKFLNLTPDRQLKYIEQLESEFDLLMKLRGQLEAKLTRLPYKTTNHNMHAIRESVESELNLVEKKLASVKLELRKLNIIKSH